MQLVEEKREVSLALFSKSGKRALTLEKNALNVSLYGLNFSLKT